MMPKQRREANRHRDKLHHMGSTDGSAGRQAGRQACMQQQKQAGGGEREEEEEEGRGAASKRMLLQAAAKCGGSNPVPTANGAQLTCP